MSMKKPVMINRQLRMSSITPSWRIPDRDGDVKVIVKIHRRQKRGKKTG